MYSIRKLSKRRSSEGLRSFNPSKGTNLLILIILAGDIEMNPGPRSLCRLCKNYCKASGKSVKGEDDHDIVFGTLIIVIPQIKKLGGRYTVIRRVTTNQTLVPCSRRATDHLLVIIVPLP